MLKRLHVRNFTVFAEADFEFSPGLNVIVGTNGTGKSHVLKLGYAVLKGQVGQVQEIVSSISPPITPAIYPPIMPAALPTPFYSFLSDQILFIFRPEPLDLLELSRRGVSNVEVVVEFELTTEGNSQGRLVFGANDAKEAPLSMAASTAIELSSQIASPILIPAKEVLTSGWMLQASRQLKIPVEETYLDLLAQLAGLSLQQPEPAAQVAINKLAELLGGEVEEQNGSYFLVSHKQKRLEMKLAAEGMRKFGTLQKLLSNGSLTPKSTLFWDEPEANLNPALLRQLAALLVQLAGQGFQIILATHSLFLLKEFHILAREQKTTVRYFGLSAAPGEATRVTTTDDLELLPDIVALDAELAQSDRFLDVLNQEDANA